MEIFDVFSMNGIENYPAAGEFFLENVILKVSQTHFSKEFYPKGGGPMPPPPWHTFFKGGGDGGGGGGGGCEVPWFGIGYALLSQIDRFCPNFAIYRIHILVNPVSLKLLS